MIRKYFKKRINSFRYAVKGIATTFKEPNFKIQIIISIAVVIAGLILKINRIEWLIVILCIGLVLAAETLNTTIEEIVDFISPERNIKAGVVKDLAAGMVLIISIASLIAGLIIFLPKIIN